ncbi:MAG TPA: hypothetical protein VE269_06385, partial [Gaiellaceae bacterium]|nr:hypothetical protein [Gaiellaceae bacterium]
MKDAMPPPERVELDVLVAGGTELLIGLFAATARHSLPTRADSWVPDVPPNDVQRALERLGSRSGELWLHLLGAAIDCVDTRAADFVEQVAALDAGELRRHV